MNNYDFLNLSPPEFENLCRDLLQKELGVHIESFAEGKDGGIDLRFSKFGKGAIIQCKRYKDYNSLINNLKKEIPKVKKLNPDRYIITTSVSLNPNQKDKIKQLFSPYIQSESGIYGNNDINNLLSKYSEVEKNHYKLWLTSSVVLEKILHSKVYNQTQFEEEAIKDLSKIYVQNESYFEAINILKENHYLIISGIPGIGKTTLARVLVYNLLSIGFEEFIYLANDINDAYTHFSDGKKQVFLFDDFLGTNFLSKNIANNEDKRIITFIEKVKKSQNKIIIFTTREYILNQAKLQYELFNKSQFDIGKCILDLSKYNKQVRAQILYNHIYFSRMPDEYIKSLIESSILPKVVDNKNYNPRIIETIIDKSIWEGTKPNKFPNAFEDFFNYPNSVWEHAYETKITTLSRYILPVICLTGTPILYDDLFKAVLNFINTFYIKYNCVCNDIEFKKSIIELENTFIITKKDTKGNLSIDFQNPSIQDFLTQYLNSKQNLLLDLMMSSIFVEQLYLNVYFDGEEEPKYSKNRIIIDRLTINNFVDKIINDFDKLTHCRVSRVEIFRGKGFEWWRSRSNDLKKIFHLSSKIKINKYSKLKDFFISKLNNSLMQSDLQLNNDDIDKIVPLISEFKNYINVPNSEIVSKIGNCAAFSDDLFAFSKLSEIYPDEYSEYIETDKFTSLLNDVIQNEIDNTDNETIDNLIDNLSGLDNLFGSDTHYERRELMAKKEEIEQNEQQDVDWRDYEFDRKVDIANSIDITSIFNTLLDK